MATDDLRNFTVRISSELLLALHELAQRNGRSVNAEALSAIRRHLAAPPAVVEAAPPMPSEEVPQGQPRPRGKPFAGGYRLRQRKKSQEEPPGDAAD